MGKAAERVERIMVVARKDWRESVNGRFLLFQFVDRDGPLKGVLWQANDEIDREINVNDVVRIKGELKPYQGAFELHVAAIVKLGENEYDPAQFIPASAERTDQVHAQIAGMISGVENEHLRALLAGIFTDEEFVGRGGDERRIQAPIEGEDVDIALQGIAPRRQVIDDEPAVLIGIWDDRSLTGHGYREPVGFEEPIELA